MMHSHPYDTNYILYATLLYANISRLFCPSPIRGRGKLLDNIFESIMLVTYNSNSDTSMSLRVIKFFFSFDSGIN